jgi:uncharacterized protein
VEDVYRAIAALRVELGQATPFLREMILARVRALLSPLGAMVIDVRIARRRIEVDFKYSSDLAEIASALKALGEVEYLRVLGGPEEIGEDETLAAALSLFNDERFWEAHEALEGLWRRKEGRAKELLSGLIKLAAAYVHLQRGRADRYFSLLGSSLRHLEACGLELYRGIDLASLRSELSETIARGKPRYITLRR